MRGKKTKAAVSLFWFRRDLRLNDNRGLFEALAKGKQVLPVFILDEDIVSGLPPSDHRIAYIYDALSGIHASLKQAGSGLWIRRGNTLEVFRQLLDDYQVQAVFCNMDHEPYGLARDEKIRTFLQSRGIPFYTYLDHLIFNKQEVLKPNAEPYLVFTPYSRQWRKAMRKDSLKTWRSEDMISHFFRDASLSLPALETFGFKRSKLKAPFPQFDAKIIGQYHQTRDYPALDATSHLGPGLRMGLYSIREVVKKAVEWNDTFLNELIWREFYAMIMWHFPRVVHESFRVEYDRIEWINDEGAFEAWKNGRTGYPLVDAGMRQLNETGYMHNRLRMITAGFLTKHLLTDWRWGEAYFASQLFDYELSSNNGGWQWSAGSGTDAAPYFRIFNPDAQQKKFDPHRLFISEWVTEYGTPEYVLPITDHKQARDRCLRTYRKVRT
jgi:deoxyribodipyrimidine photo-lyase